MITISSKGDFNKTVKFLKNIRTKRIYHILEKYGEKGVRALSESTPKDTGKTASSWNYEIEENNGIYKIVWSNSNVVNHINIAVILQYGHATGNGGYVAGRDYINPAMQPIFDEIANKAWIEVIDE